MKESHMNNPLDGLLLFHHVKQNVTCGQCGIRVLVNRKESEAHRIWGFVRTTKSWFAHDNLGCCLLSWSNFNRVLLYP